LFVERRAPVEVRLGVFGNVKSKSDRKRIPVRLISASDPKVSRAVTFDVVVIWRRQYTAHGYA
jgi:hypothetical protein